MIRRALSRLVLAALTALVVLLLCVGSALCNDVRIHTADFSEWEVLSNENVTKTYHDGEYVFQIRTANFLVSTWIPMPDAVDGDFSLEATARRFSGGDDATYGLIWGTDDENYYAIFISADGFYRVMYRGKNVWQTDPVQWTASALIERGDAENVLRLSVSGDLATILINNIIATTFQLDMRGPYQVGVLGGAEKNIPVEIRFTTFAVDIPSEENRSEMPQDREESEPLSQLPQFSDTFDDENTGWVSGEWEIGGQGYRESEYSIWVNTEHYILWAWAPLEELASGDFVAEVTARRHSGARDALVGLVFGWDDQNYYSVRVSDDGLYIVSYSRKGVWQPAPVTWAVNSDVARDEQPVHLRLIVHGDQAAVIANGVLLAVFELEIEGPYKIGIAAESDAMAPVEIRFTDFLVRSVTAQDIAEVADGVAIQTSALHALPFADSFDDIGSGWGRSSSDSGGRAYRAGEYAIWLDITNRLYRAWAPLEELISGEFVVSISTRNASGVNNAESGIIWGADNDNYYALFVSADGFYRVMYIRKGVWQTDPVRWTQSLAIRQGTALNVLQVSVNNGKATIAVNEETLTSFPLEMQGPYKVGVLGASSAHAPIEIRILEFSVFTAEAKPAIESVSDPGNADSEDGVPDEMD